MVSGQVQEAYEEMVADSMEAVLSDGQAVEKLAKLRRQDESLWEKLRQGIRNLAQKIRKAYEGLEDASRNFQAAEQADVTFESSWRENEKTARMGGGVLYSQRESYENAVQKIADISAAEYHKYNIVITVFDLHKNYLNQMFKKRNAKVRYKNESLAQVNPQLHE